MKRNRGLFTLFAHGLILTAVFAGRVAAAPAEWSGIHPELAYFNDEGECGTGAVVP